MDDLQSNFTSNVSEDNAAVSDLRCVHQLKPDSLQKWGVSTNLTGGASMWDPLDSLSSQDLFTMLRTSILVCLPSDSLDTRSGLG